MNKYYTIILATIALFMFSCENVNIKKSTLDSESASSSVEFINPGIMTPEVLWKLGRVSEVQVSPDGKNILFAITRYELAENKGDKNIFVMSADGGEPTQLTFCKKSEYNGIWNADGSKIGFISQKSGESQMWEMNIDGSNKKQVSDIKGGIGSFKYSTTGNKIAFSKSVKIDATTLDLYPDLPKANAKIYNDLMYRHWDHWADENYSHIFIANYSNGKLENSKDLMSGERLDASIGNCSWNNDDTKLAISYKRLFGKDFAISTNTEIYIYDLVNDFDNELTNSINLTKEGFEGYDNGPVWSPDGNILVWSSMAKDGFESDKNRIMVHNFATGETVDYSEGFDQSSTDFVFSADSKVIYFISGIEATYQIYSIGVDNKTINQITNGDHNYQSIAIADHKLIGSKMNMKIPTEIYSITGIGEETQLSFTNKEILDKVTPAEFEKRWVETTDGKKELVWVIYPPNFDKNKKYPALLYCQGGPQSAVSQFFSYRWNFQIMASNGYIVVAPNRRGLPTFGQEWNDQISGDYGGQNMDDYLSAIDELAKEPYVDENNLGAIGASYGGYSIYWLAGHHEGRFKALISHCGIFDLPSMYAATEETFFVQHDLGGAPWEKEQPKSYKQFNPRNFVGNWDAPILVITGGYDFRIPYAQSMQAFNAAQLNDVPSRFLFFPDESHFVVQPQNSVLWQREFKGFLDNYLKPTK
ncbi:MAG: S9 family peptidase [Bacteroidales bacterium]|nr:S9 family peptidase [Bacteroidales bacterium]